MNRTALYWVGGALAIAIVYVLYRRHQNNAQQQAEQKPAADAQANYTVPPSIGAQVDNTGGANFPQGIPPGTTVVYNRGQTQPLPLKN